MVNTPTRITSMSFTCVDHIFGKATESMSLYLLVCDQSITDYQATFLLIDMVIFPTDNNNKNIKIINYYRNYNEFENLALNTN